MSRVFLPTHYMIWIRRKAKRDFALAAGGGLHEAQKKT